MKQQFYEKMHRVVEVENVKTFERSSLKHLTLKKGDTITNHRGTWVVTRTYHSTGGY